MSKLPELNEADVKKVIGERIRSVLQNKLVPPAKTIVEAGKQLLKEAVVLIPKTFILKTEFLSALTKENHFKVYKNEVDSFNKVSSKLDTVNRTDAENPDNSEFRRLKMDEQRNLNGVKLHELYFNNISDLASEIRMDSLPYIRLANFWGTFEAWQFDFRACGMAATEGWAVCYFDPFKQRYMNTVVEQNSENIPLLGIPVLVIDTHHHAWFRDHPGDKMNYLNAMLKEVNWQIVEARMAVAEMTNIHQLFQIVPVQPDPQKLVRMNPSTEAPIGREQVVSSKTPVTP